jgi:hypothetical protein
MDYARRREGGIFLRALRLFARQFRRQFFPVHLGAALFPPLSEPGDDIQQDRKQPAQDLDHGVNCAKPIPRVAFVIVVHARQAKRNEGNAAPGIPQDGFQQG